MSLTLDDVRRVRFRMAKRNAGYEVGDVDLFIDKVESAFQQLENERDILRREAESNGGDQGVDNSQLEAKDEEIARLRAENEQLRNAPKQQFVAQQGQQPASNGGEAHRAELARRDEQQAELERRNTELQAELERVRGELNEARTQRVGEAVGRAEKVEVTTREEASPAVIRLVQLATEQAEQVVQEADEEARRKVEEAEQKAREITTDARTKAERIESEARVNAEQVRSEAQQNADQVNLDADRRRHELFDDLDRERDDLSGKVGQLRDFEQRYRTNLRGFFERNLAFLDGEQAEPADAPEIEPARSSTPRLDALAGESQS